jgi:hypothetical protein
MRAQRRAGRRSAQTLAENHVIVNSWRSRLGKALSDRYDRLLVLIDPHGTPLNLDHEAVLRQLPHRKRVGFAVGARPAGALRSPDWSAKIRDLDLDVVEFAAAGGLAQARMASCLEFHLRTMRSLYRDRKIDGVLIVCPTFSLQPLAHAIHDTGRTLVVADLEEYLGQSASVADSVFAIDRFIASERL